MNQGDDNPNQQMQGGSSGEDATNPVPDVGAPPLATGDHQWLTIPEPDPPSALEIGGAWQRLWGWAKKIRRAILAAGGAKIMAAGALILAILGGVVYVAVNYLPESTVLTEGIFEDMLQVPNEPQPGTGVSDDDAAVVPAVGAENAPCPDVHDPISLDTANFDLDAYENLDGHISVWFTEELREPDGNCDHQWHYAIPADFSPDEDWNTINRTLEMLAFVCQRDDYDALQRWVCTREGKYLTVDLVSPAEVWILWQTPINGDLNATTNPEVPGVGEANPPPVDEISDLVALDWSRAVVEDASISTISEVVAGGPGFVAVGSATQYDDANYEIGPSAAVWTSTDGLIWRRAPHDSADFALGSSMVSVAAGPEGLVAVGRVGSEGAVWRSQDGFGWTRVPTDPTFKGRDGSGGGATLSGVTAGGSGYIAVGHGVIPDTFQRFNRAWTSPDGTDWAMTDLPGRCSTDIAARGLGYVAVGTSRPVESHQVGIVCVSSDGLNWTLAPPIDPWQAQGELEMWAVTSLDNGFVAVGWEQNDDRLYAGHSWFSADGTNWTATPPLANSRIQGVTEYKGTLIAVGVRRLNDFFENETLGLWTSSGGDPNWTQVVGLPKDESFVTDGDNEAWHVVATDRIVVVVGVDNNGPAVWVATG